MLALGPELRTPNVSGNNRINNGNFSPPPGGVFFPPGRFIEIPDSRGTAEDQGICGPVAIKIRVCGLAHLGKYSRWWVRYHLL